MCIDNEKKVMKYIHKENYFLNLVDLYQILIVVTLFRLIWYQTEHSLVPNHSEKGNYNPNLVKINQVQKKVLFVYNKMFCMQNQFINFRSEIVYAVL